MYTGSTRDRYSDFVEDSTSHKLKSAYWNTKQAMIRKLGKEEDKFVVASDSELDAKLSLFKSVESTCRDLSVCIELYLKSIYVLSQSENDMGRFLKKKSSDDRTRAGKILAAVGKALSHSAQQRLILQNPLTRLDHELETFRLRAIGDTESTINRMETARTKYRGALLWMKNVSEELDPDRYKKLDKYRRVQTQVRKSKSNFDRLKLASMQKVDLLAASRCNMLSQVLATYQDNLLQFWERSARTMTTVANSFKGYQFYEFSLLKDLTSETRKLADQTSTDDDDQSTKKNGKATGESKKPGDVLTEEDIDAKLQNLFDTEDLLLDETSTEGDNQIMFDNLIDSFNKNQPDSKMTPSNEETNFLTDILSLNPSNLPNEFEQSKDGGDGAQSNPLIPSLAELGKQNSDAPLFKVNWDSQMTDVFGRKELGAVPTSPPFNWGMRDPAAPAANLSWSPGALAPSGMPRTDRPMLGGALGQSKPRSTDVDAWMNFLADLTPLGNPDQQSKKSGHVLDA